MQVLGQLHQKLTPFYPEFIRNTSIWIHFEFVSTYLALSIVTWDFAIYKQKFLNFVSNFYEVLNKNLIKIIKKKRRNFV